GPGRQHSAHPPEAGSCRSRHAKLPVCGYWSTADGDQHRSSGARPETESGSVFLVTKTSQVMSQLAMPSMTWGSVCWAGSYSSGVEGPEPGKKRWLSAS